MSVKDGHRECKYCKKEFISSHKHRIYCSDDCFKLWRKADQHKKQQDRYDQRCTCRHCGAKHAFSKLYKAQCCSQEECVEKEKRRRSRLTNKRYYSRNHKKRNKKREAETSKRYRKNNRSKVNEKDRFRKKQKRMQIIEYKKSACCQKCGEIRWFCLEFHHIDPSQKKFGIANSVNQGYGWTAILREINKCVVLCGNCHKHLHYLEKHIDGWEMDRNWLHEDRSKDNDMEFDDG